MFEKGYKIKIFDYKNMHCSFIEVLIDYLKESNEKYVVVGFDDLYFTKFDVLSEIELNQIFNQLSIGVVRLDGRVPSNGSYAVSIGGVDFYYHHGKYQLSTVFSAFSLESLETLYNNGVRTAWDIEGSELPALSVIAPKKRYLKYSNLIVKGKLDIVAVIRTNIALNLSYSLIRLVKRVVVQFIRIF